MSTILIIIIIYMNLIDQIFIKRFGRDLYNFL